LVNVVCEEVEEAASEVSQQNCQHDQLEHLVDILNLELDRDATASCLTTRNDVTNFLESLQREQVDDTWKSHHSQKFEHDQLRVLVFLRLICLANLFLIDEVEGEGGEEIEEKPATSRIPLDDCLVFADPRAVRAMVHSHTIEDDVQAEE